MNWDALGAIGEVVGAVAVLATLIYLARQVREGNTYARSSTIQETNASYISVFSQLTQDAEMALIYSRALNNQELDEAESVRYAAFANTFFAWFESTYFSSTASYLAEEFTAEVSVMTLVGPYAKRILAAKAGAEWWLSDAPHLYAPSFVSKVNEQILDEGT